MTVPRTGRKARTNDGQSPVKKSQRAASRKDGAEKVRKSRRAMKIMRKIVDNFDFGIYLASWL